MLVGVYVAGAYRVVEALGIRYVAYGSHTWLVAVEVTCIGLGASARWMAYQDDPEEAYVEESTLRETRLDSGHRLRSRLSLLVQERSGMPIVYVSRRRALDFERNYLNEIFAFCLGDQRLKFWSRECIYQPSFRNDE